MLAAFPMAEKSWEIEIVGHAGAVGDCLGIVSQMAMAVGTIEKIGGAERLLVIEFRGAGEIGNCRGILAHLIKQIGAAVVTHGAFRRELDHLVSVPKRLGVTTHLF